MEEEMVKSEFVKIRLSDVEKEAFQRSATIAGISLSAWMRERLRKAAAAELGQAGKEIPFYRLKDEGDL
jgi:uncharacterized protein (DUF1778 family)